MLRGFVINLCKVLDRRRAELVNEYKTQGLKANVILRHISFVVLVDVYWRAIFMFEHEFEKKMKFDPLYQSCHAVLRGTEDEFLSVSPATNFLEEFLNP